jgi:hypothetical protein
MNWKVHVRFWGGPREKGQPWYLASGPSYHDALVIDEMGQQVGSLRVAHTKAGLDDLKRFLLDIAKTPEQLACIVETPRGLLIACTGYLGYLFQKEYQ